MLLRPVVVRRDAGPVVDDQLRFEAAHRGDSARRARQRSRSIEVTEAVVVLAREGHVFHTGLSRQVRLFVRVELGRDGTCGRGCRRLLPAPCPAGLLSGPGVGPRKISPISVPGKLIGARWMNVQKRMFLRRLMTARGSPGSLRTGPAGAARR